MSQEQPHKPQDPITYGDVFHVSGELASRPIAPRDAAMMQSAETQVLGRTQKEGAAAMMESAAEQNERRGVVHHTDVTDLVQKRGVEVDRANVSGRRLIVESVAGQVVGQYPGEQGKLTIGHALEAASITVGHKPVDHSDAAAIKAAEMRATGRDGVTPGGVAEEALQAAVRNEQVTKIEDKTKISDVLMDATGMLPKDKEVMLEDAEAVMMAERSKNPTMSNYKGGVSDTMAAAARINQQTGSV